MAVWGVEAAGILTPVFMVLGAVVKVMTVVAVKILTW